jgi:hypothetical protein
MDRSAVAVTLQLENINRYISRLRVRELKLVLSTYRLPCYGLKKDLQDRLIEHLRSLVANRNFVMFQQVRRRVLEVAIGEEK